MQDLLAELLWRNVEIDEAANRLCQTLPGFSEAKQAYDNLSEQLRPPPAWPSACCPPTRPSPPSACVWAGVP